MWETMDSTIDTIDGLTPSSDIDGLAVPIVFDVIGDSFVFIILLIFECFIRMNSQLALSRNFKYKTERNSSGWRNAPLPFTAEEINMLKDIEKLLSFFPTSK